MRVLAVFIAFFIAWITLPVLDAMRDHLELKYDVYRIDPNGETALAFSGVTIPKRVDDTLTFTLDGDYYQISGDFVIKRQR